ncbi:MAG: hypothetical protein IJ562_04275 [Prevotella sp.]|nr:hypothetical protein [Lachnospiraceae bacterium]MBR1400792.1 hypothetical protein [Prevotella sp.]
MEKRRLKVTVEVPEYQLGKAITIDRSSDSKIVVAIVDDEMVIAANRNGLVDLARYFLFLAQKTVPNGECIRITDKNGLLKGSIDLKIRKEALPAKERKGFL